MNSHRVINRRNQLLELHVADQVLLVEPLGTVELPQTDELPPDVLELQRRMLIDLIPVDEPETPAQPQKPRRKRAAAKRSTSATRRRATTRKSSAPRTSRGD
jgi:hypothetical protein